jgi:hypothetical protein
MSWRERLGFEGGQQSTNSEIIAETFAAAGAYVMGRRMMDGGEMPWGEAPPFHAPVFVVTHRPHPVIERPASAGVQQGFTTAMWVSPPTSGQCAVIDGTTFIADVKSSQALFVREVCPVARGAVEQATQRFKIAVRHAWPGRGQEHPRPAVRLEFHLWVGLVMWGTSRTPKGVWLPSATVSGYR